jgi:glutamate racemase
MSNNNQVSKGRTHFNFSILHNKYNKIKLKSYSKTKKFIFLLNMNNEKPIGVFDSGIGGLSVLKQFIRFLPSEKYIYLGDTARVPYGNRSADTVCKYTKQCVEFLMEQDVKYIVIACNTASSVAMEVVRDIANVPVIDMISPAVTAAVRATTNGKIGIIGTRATINSKAYTNGILNLEVDKQIQVFSQACPLFVPIVEEGWLSHPATRLVAEEYLKCLIQQNIDTLVMGCTHYPLLRQLIMELMPGINLIDTGEHAAVNAIRLLAEQKSLVEDHHDVISKPDAVFYVTDVPSTFYEVAKLFLGFEVESPQRVVLGN